MELVVDKDWAPPCPVGQSGAPPTGLLRELGWHERDPVRALWQATRMDEDLAQPTTRLSNQLVAALKG